MTTNAHPSHGSKSPTGYPLCGWRGLRGPTYRQPRNFPHPTISQIPHPHTDFVLPYLDPRGKEKEKLKCKNKPTFHPVSELHAYT